MLYIIYYGSVLFEPNRPYNEGKKSRFVAAPPGQFAGVFSRPDGSESRPTPSPPRFPNRNPSHPKATPWHPTGTQQDQTPDRKQTSKHFHGLNCEVIDFIWGQSLFSVLLLNPGDPPKSAICGPTGRCRVRAGKTSNFCPSV